MSTRDRADALLGLINGSHNVGHLFLSLYEFIERTSGAAFGWFPLGWSAVDGVALDFEVRRWRSELRNCISENSGFGELAAIADLAQTLEQISISGCVAATDSARLVVALRVLDDAFAGVHAAEVADDTDTPGFVAFRTKLRAGAPLFESGELRVYPKPRRAHPTAERGQGRIADLLKVLAVVRSIAGLNVEYLVCLSRGTVGPVGFQKIGLVPAVAHHRELAWTRTENEKYSVAEHASACDTVIARVLFALDTLSDAGAELILLPELVSGTRLHQAVCERLEQRKDTGRVTPILILAGTQMISAADGYDRNRAFVLNEEGDIVWSQDKMHAYTFTATEQVTAGHPLGATDLRTRDEDIAFDPRTVKIVDISASQRLVVLTCEDFIQVQPHQQALIEICATTILVPIMGGLRDAHSSWLRDGAMNYIRHPSATSIISNSGALVPLGNEESRHFGEIWSSPRLTDPIWIPYQFEAELRPAAWLVELNRIV